MLQTLVGSRVRTRVLTWFVMHPGDEQHLKGMVRELGENNNAIRRELNRLEGIGLLRSRQRGRSKFYSVNQEHLIYPELKSIVHKTAGLGDVLRASMEPLGRIECASVYGSVARGDEDEVSDVDLMIVGDVDVASLRSVLRAMEEEIGREINETLYTPAEFAELRGENDPFLRRVLSGARIGLIGELDDFA